MHRLLTVAGLIALGLIFVLTAPRAHEYRVGAIRIDHPWARAAPVDPSADPATGPWTGKASTGGFLVLTNEGSEDDRLVGATTDVAERVEIRRQVDEDGVMRMHTVEGGVDVPAGETVAFAPGTYRIMLIGLKQPLIEGDQVPVILEFERAGTVTVQLTVEDAISMGALGGGLPLPARAG